MSGESVAASQLRAFVERAERLNGEKTAINQDLSELFKEMKGEGYDTKVVKAIISDRAKDPAKKSEFEAIYDLYADALGMVPATRAPAQADEEIIEPQVVPQPAQMLSDAGATPASVVIATSLAGAEGIVDRQPIQPETANEDIRVQDAKALTVEAAAAVKPEPAQEAQILRPGPVRYAEPGIVTFQQNGPEPMVAHPYATCWPVNSIDVTGGVREPIVQIGALILDGRGRYLAARRTHTGANTTLEYPTVQYDGTDPLADCIRWNMASRTMSGGPLRTVAHKLCKLEPERADEILDLMGLAEQNEAAE